MTTPYQLPKHAEPEPEPGDARFFEAAKEGRLLYKRCRACGQPHYYPRAYCPFCMSDETDWCEAAGTGEIYTFSVTRRAGPVPYAIAYVTLDEGVKMMTNIVDCDLDDIRIGQRVRLVYKPTVGDIPIACFTPV
ncbi:MAG: Zn-ribbon domain-containing OB-fold protein [Rhodocyclaceae bacterium]|nr:Zn-ribbon domain-containing OB-fold protein [Rhodocyclaceae bacterium]